MNRYIVTLKTATSTRNIVVAADGIIDARIKADRQRNKGETVLRAVSYEPKIMVS